MEGVTLEDVLSFMSGSLRIPSDGFSPKPQLQFDSSAVFPTANTCLVRLVLPTTYKTYNEFRERIVFGMKNHGGFGLV